jgi:hypothetical protein
MVDVKKIKQLLAKHFDIDGNISIDPELGVVDVAGDARLKTTTSQLLVKFGHVTGDFYCYDNNLVSLEGAPHSVGGSFYCYSNSLTTLNGAPASVGGNFWCDKNRLTTLDGAPASVGDDFWCYDNSLKSLDGAPNSVGGDFYCRRNSLTALEGAPSSVGGKFYVDYNTSLPLLRLLQYNKIDIEDAPQVVNQIINKYAGTGKRGMLGAAAELTKAGFRDNARW